MKTNNNSFEERNEKTQLSSNPFLFNNTCSSQILRASLSSPLLNKVKFSKLNC